MYKPILILALSILLLLNTAFGLPQHITSPTNQSYRVSFSDGQYYSGTSNINHLTVTPTNTSGNYRVWIAWNDIYTRAAYFSYGDNTSQPISWNSYRIDDNLPIPWPNGTPGFTAHSNIASDSNGNIYFSIAAWTNPNPNESYLLKAPQNPTVDQWGVWKIWPLDFTRLQSDVAFGCLTVSKNGNYTTFSSQITHTPGKFLPAAQDSYTGHIFSSAQNLNSLPTNYWDHIIFGGYDYPSEGYWGSSCVVANDGTGLVVAKRFALDHMPGRISGAFGGYNFGVGNTSHSSWQFARCPFYHSNHTNVFSLAPYVDEYNGNKKAYFVSTAAHWTVASPVWFNYYDFNAGVQSSAWSSDYDLTTDNIYFSPQVDFYRDHNGNGYLIVLFSIYDPSSSPVHGRVMMGIWNLDNPQNMIVSPFLVAENEDWSTYGQNYNQDFPNVSVEKSPNGSAVFDIHVCWTNYHEVSQTDPIAYDKSEVYYRTFHFNPR
jgi:hypothetical protein